MWLGTLSSRAWWGLVGVGVAACVSSEPRVGGDAEDVAGDTGGDTGTGEVADTGADTSGDTGGGDAVEPGCMEGEPCDNGRGPALGDCGSGYAVLPDRCEAGECVDVVFGPPATGYPLVGTWVVIVNAVGANGVGVRTLRAVIDVGADGAIDVDEAESSDPLWRATLLGEAAESGRVCLGPNGELQMTLGNFTFMGAVDVDGAFIIGGGPGLFGVGARRSGDASQVSGVYRVVQIGERVVGKTLNTLRGDLRFEQGCMMGAGAFVDERGDGFALSPDVQNRCLDGEDEDYTLEVGVTTAEMGRVVLPARLRLTVARGGDVLIGTYDETLEVGAPRPGMIAFVRETDEVQPDLRGPFSMASIEAISGGVVSERIDVDLGFEGFEQGHVSSGTQGAAVSGGWYALGEKRTYAHRLVTTDGDARHASGWLAPDAHLGMLVHVASVGPADAPSVLPADPVTGGMVFFVRRGEMGQPVGAR